MRSSTTLLSRQRPNIVVSSSIGFFLLQLFVCIGDIYRYMWCDPWSRLNGHIFFLLFNLMSRFLSVHRIGMEQSRNPYDNHLIKRLRSSERESFRAKVDRRRISDKFHTPPPVTVAVVWHWRSFFYAWCDFDHQKNKSFNDGSFSCVDWNDFLLCRSVSIVFRTWTQLNAFGHHRESTMSPKTKTIGFCRVFFFYYFGMKWASPQWRSRPWWGFWWLTSSLKW